MSEWIQGARTKILSWIEEKKAGPLVRKPALKHLSSMDQSPVPNRIRLQRTPRKLNQYITGTTTRVRKVEKVSP